MIDFVAYDYMNYDVCCVFVVASLFFGGGGHF